MFEIARKASLRQTMKIKELKRNKLITLNKE